MTLKTILDKLKPYTATVTWIVALALIAGLLLGYERFVMWKIQEQNLFLDTPLFFRELMVQPGGLLSYAGCFLTQLLYYPVLGVAVLCALWWLLLWLMRRTFRVSETWAPLLLVPVALLLVANVDMGYWIYPVKLRGWYFVATLGMTAIVALLWAYRRLSPSRLWRRLLLVAVTVAGYPLMGTYALAATVLMALWCWRLDSQRWQAATDGVLALITVAAIPLLCYHYVYYQTNIVNLWWMALPTFKILEEDTMYYVPYALLAVCLLLLTLCRWDQAATSISKSKRRVQLAVVVIVLAVTVAGVWKGWMKDENFHRESAMQYYADQARWEEVLAEAAKQQDVPTRSIVMLRNLALSRLGRQGSEQYLYRNGSKKPAVSFAPPSSMIVGSLIYYHYGMLNDCHHMCIEGGVEFGWRVEHLKYMARCTLMSGETNALYKYTGLLKHTLFHGAWADHMETLQQQPQQRREDKETGPVTHMLQYPDAVGADHGYAERYLMNHLAKMDSDDPYFQEQCLLATLWTKDSRLFWPRFANYLRQHPGQPIPRYYQEAAWLFASTENNAPFEVPVDEMVKQRYKAFTGVLPRFDGMDIEEVREALYPVYGDTYFFEFYLTEDIAYL
jgi:hypothetical protein